MLLTALLSQKRRIDNLLSVMTGVSLNSAPIDVGCLDVNHSSLFIDGNVFFFFFKVGSIEGQVLSWKSMPPICCRIQTIKVELLLRAAVMV